MDLSGALPRVFSLAHLGDQWRDVLDTPAPQMLDFLKYNLRTAKKGRDEKSIDGWSLRRDIFSVFCSITSTEDSVSLLASQLIAEHSLASVHRQLYRDLSCVVETFAESSSTGLVTCTKSKLFQMTLLVCDYITAMNRALLEHTCRERKVKGWISQWQQFVENCSDLLLQVQRKLCVRSTDSSEFDAKRRKLTNLGWQCEYLTEDSNHIVQLICRMAITLLFERPTRQATDVAFHFRNSEKILSILDCHHEAEAVIAKNFDLESHSEESGEPLRPQFGILTYTLARIYSLLERDFVLPASLPCFSLLLQKILSDNCAGKIGFKFLTVAMKCFEDNNAGILSMWQNCSANIANFLGPFLLELCEYAESCPKACTRRGCVETITNIVISEESGCMSEFVVQRMLHQVIHEKDSYVRVRLVKLITIAAARILLDPVYKNLDNFMEIVKVILEVLFEDHLREQIACLQSLHTFIWINPLTTALAKDIVTDQTRLMFVLPQTSEFMTKHIRNGLFPKLYEILSAKGQNQCSSPTLKVIVLKTKESILCNHPPEAILGWLKSSSLKLDIEKILKFCENHIQLELNCVSILQSVHSTQTAEMVAGIFWNMFLQEQNQTGQAAFWIPVVNRLNERERNCARLVFICLAEQGKCEIPAAIDLLFYVATNAEDYIDSQILASENVTTITIGACKTISILLQTRQNIILSEESEDYVLFLLSRMVTELSSSQDGTYTPNSATRSVDSELTRCCYREIMTTVFNSIPHIRNMTVKECISDHLHEGALNLIVLDSRQFALILSVMKSGATIACNVCEEIDQIFANGAVSASLAISFVLFVGNVLSCEFRRFMVGYISPLKFPSSDQEDSLKSSVLSMNHADFEISQRTEEVQRYLSKESFLSRYVPFLEKLAFGDDAMSTEDENTTRMKAAALHTLGKFSAISNEIAMKLKPTLFQIISDYKEERFYSQLRLEALVVWTDCLNRGVLTQEESQGIGLLLFKHVMQDVSDAVQLRALSLLCACVIRRIIPQENALIFIGICTTHDNTNISAISCEIFNTYFKMNSKSSSSKVKVIFAVLQNIHNHAEKIKYGRLTKTLLALMSKSQIGELATILVNCLISGEESKNDCYMAVLSRLRPTLRSLEALFALRDSIYRLSEVNEDAFRTIAEYVGEGKAVLPQTSPPALKKFVQILSANDSGKRSKFALKYQPLEEEKICDWNERLKVFTKEV